MQAVDLKIIYLFVEPLQNKALPTSQSAARLKKSSSIVTILICSFGLRSQKIDLDYE
jgi:hypothetical protein